MSASATSLKAQIRNLAIRKNVKAQVLLQNYMFERFLERLSLSEHKDKFVLKGGMLIATFVGMDARSTMDLDTTLRGLPFTDEIVRSTISAICACPIKDEVSFSVGAIVPIRTDDIYGGYRVKVVASYDSIEVPFSIDITTGDVITPRAVKCFLRGIFDEEKLIEIWAYNIETVLAEKIKTVLRRNTLNTRPRDFYDVFIIGTTQTFDKVLLKDAITATAAHRGTTGQISDVPTILSAISGSTELRQQGEKYRKEFDYASDITFEQALNTLSDICAMFEEGSL